jgi:hypothetical protein
LFTFSFDMKKFILNCLAFVPLVVLLVFAMNRNYFPTKAMGSDGYLGAMVDKHAYAAKLASPRIIFAGGSNVAFGTDSKSIQNATGLPVVNMGLNASLGLEFMLNELRDIARPNDIVVISPEYYLSVYGDYKFKKEAQRIYPPAGKYFKQTPAQFLHDFFIDDLQKKFYITFSHLTGHQIRHFPTNVVYSRGSFNQNGDVVRNFAPHPSHDFLKKFVLDYQKNPDIPLLNDFKDFADAHHIRVYFIYPSLDQLAYNRKSKLITSIDAEFRKNMRITMLNYPEDSVLPDSLFYDTEYHLIPQGSHLRGQQIIKLLKQNGIGR